MILHILSRRPETECELCKVPSVESIHPAPSSNKYTVGLYDPWAMLFILLPQYWNSHIQHDAG